jgi:AcrR family transcriptional regulator
MKTLTKADRTRQFILEKTAPLFNTKGISGVAVSDIMEATNMAKGSLYVHFQDKEDLTNSVVDYNLKLFVDRTSAVVDGHQSAKDKFLALLDYMADPMNPVVEGGCPMMNFGMEADDTNPHIRRKVGKVICSVQDAMLDILERGVENKEFKNRWNIEEYATKAYAMIEGGILITRVTRNNDKMTLLVGILKRELEENSI